MPFFGRSNAETVPATTTTNNEVPNRRRSMFGRKDNTANTTITHTTHQNSPTRNSGTGLLHRHEDASIESAKQSLFRAEKAERNADEALNQAKIAVRNAREHVKRLEREAAEEARLAKIKQKQAHVIGKRGKALGPCLNNHPHRALSSSPSPRHLNTCSAYTCLSCLRSMRLLFLQANERITLIFFCSHLSGFTFAECIPAFEHERGERGIGCTILA
ncbi:uncharacterized protein BDZ99DRAFT_28307 [Mytilinidion resinicola]|uniref:Uncharacterized protein n=1 Tax=Mytilinidion resinicola TaxID=574789 RepID=A0A6A6YN69_9PEZI|nr:uncharacterized protein BDZ99DRAFT_28307 [Mytilinidion resinicola]KAF2809415.1 hypothetical protein BDZ99DRAFT_28307 [Mytilinidion resinicola]